MTKTKIGEHQKDFIAQLLNLLAENQTNVAIEKLRAVENDMSRFDTLYSLVMASQVGELSEQLRIKMLPLRSLRTAHALARDSALDLDRARARDLARALALARDLARDLARYFVLSIEDLEAVANFLVSLINSSRIRSEQKTEIEFRYQNRLAIIFDEVQYLKQREAAPIFDVVSEIMWDEIQKHSLLVTLEGAEEINADVLSTQITPFMQSLQGLYDVHAKIMGKPAEKLRIVQIHNETPHTEIKQLTGLSGVVKSIYDYLDKIYGDPEVKESTIDKTRAEADKLREDSDIERAKLALQVADWERDNLPKYLEIAEKYLKDNYPDLTPEQRLAHAQSVANLHMQMALSRLKIRIGWHDIPRPHITPELLE